MSDDSIEMEEIRFVVEQDSSQWNISDFAKSEIERTRSFKYERLNGPKGFSLDNMHLFVRYDRNGNGSCKVDFVEID